MSHSNWRWAAGLAASAAVLVGIPLYLHFRAANVATAAADEKVVAPKIAVGMEQNSSGTRALGHVAERVPQTGQELLKALIAQHYLAESRKPEAERRKEREHAYLLRDLHRIQGARLAASQLLAGDPDSATVWAVAASVADPATGGEIFAAAASLKADLRLVPIYIAALDSVRTRARATELLCSASGKRLGSQKEVWLSWWAGARSQARDD